ncbi:MAG TPA: hypothetical protein VHJ83_04590 [Micromonosporaceae bacterium]|nr:hypothetical protein [Micromonosporaceae bacterium]
MREYDLHDRVRAAEEDMARTLLKVPVSDHEDQFIEVEVEHRDVAGVELVPDEADGPATAPFTLASSVGRTMPAINTVTVTWRKPVESGR